MQQIKIILEQKILFQNKLDRIIYVDLFVGPIQAQNTNLEWKEGLCDWSAGGNVRYTQRNPHPPGGHSSRFDPEFWMG